MKEYKIGCNSHFWTCRASTIEGAVRKVIKSEKNRLKNRGKEIGKRLKLSNLNISWDGNETEVSQNV